MLIISVPGQILTRVYIYEEYIYEAIPHVRFVVSTGWLEFKLLEGKNHILFCILQMFMVTGQIR